MLHLFKRNNKFKISEPERNWADSNLKWLIQIFGIPQSNQISFDSTNFERTFNANAFQIENFLSDVSAHLDLQNEQITVHFFQDSRDLKETPLEIEGSTEESAFEIEKGEFKIHLANYLKNYEDLLMSAIIFELIRIKLQKADCFFIQDDTGAPLTYHAATHFGFGFLISQTLGFSKNTVDTFWETTIRGISDFPVELMTFALASFSFYFEKDYKLWIDKLPQKIKDQLPDAVELIRTNPSKILTPEELNAAKLCHEALEAVNAKDYNKAIRLNHDILKLTSDEFTRVEALNNLGYYESIVGEYSKSVTHLQTAIELDPGFSFAYDNLGYSLICQGKLEEGKSFIEQAVKSGSNEPSYTNRNLGLYYQLKGEPMIAEKHFKLAIEQAIEPVDFLDFHYGEFLIAENRTEEGVGFLKKAAENGEKKAQVTLEKLNYES